MSERYYFMRPPMCYVCDKDFDTDEGDLLYFKKGEKGIAWDKKMEQPGFVGHPPYAEWFCNEHIEEWKKLQHLTFSEAKKKIKG